MDTWTHRLLKTASLLLALLLANACVTSRSLRQEFNRGKHAYARGEVLHSYRILQGMDMSGKVPPKEYFQVLAEVTRAAEYLMAQWLEEGQRSQEEGDLLRALSYYEDLMRALPEEDPLRKKVEARAEPVREQLADLRKQIHEWVEKAQTDFAAGRIEDARLNLIQAREQSFRNQLDFPLDQERLLAECDRRLPAPVVELSEVEAPTEPQDGETALPKDAGPGVLVSKLPKRRVRRRPRRPRRRPKPRRRVVDPKEDSAPVAVTDKPAPSGGQVAQLMKKATKLRQQKHWSDAIVTYRRILRLEPGHEGAKAALGQLKPERDRLIAAWMKEAGEYFAHEQLGKAAPLYRRVLQIDPGNLRAKEGLQMYKRLIEIKNKNK